MKPTDLNFYIERLHQDGAWRLVFYSHLWSDPAFDIAQDPVLDALGCLNERRPGLFTLLAGITTPLTPGAKGLLRPDLPDAVGTWFDPAILPWPISTWCWCTLADLDSLQHALMRDIIPLPPSERNTLMTWVSAARIGLTDLDALSLPVPTIGAEGAGFVLNAEMPYSDRPAHAHCKGLADKAGLLPIRPDTIRLLVGFDTP